MPKRRDLPTVWHALQTAHRHGARRRLSRFEEGPVRCFRGPYVALKICLLAGMLLLFEPVLHAQSQAAAKSAAAGAGDGSPAAGSVEPSPSLTSVPRVPGVAALLSGLNAGLNYAAGHNSSIGWYTVMTPAVSYAFSQHFSADVSSSLYFDRKFYETLPGNPARQQLEENEADAGDTLFGFHAAAQSGAFQNVATFTLSAPTGDTESGLGAGQVTYDGTGHLEAFRGQLGGFVELGVGDSAGLFNNVVAKDYNSVGGLAHFMAGAEDWVGDKLYVELLAYEQLPFGAQRLFVVVRPPPGQPPPPAAGTVVNTGASEDNGLTTYVGVPVTGNLMLSGYYSRSLRRRTDTASFGFTWVLRGNGRKRDSLADRALKEAEQPQ